MGSPNTATQKPKAAARAKGGVLFELRRALYQRKLLYRYMRDNRPELLEAAAGRSAKNSVTAFHRLPVTDIPCPICAADGLSHSAPYPSDLAPFRDWVVYFCAACGSGFVPDSEQLLGDNYARNFAHGHDTTRLAPPKEYFAATSDPVVQLRQRRALDQIEALRANGAQFGRLLDFGAGPGFLLKAAAPAEAFAIETDVAAHKHLEYIGAKRLELSDLDTHRFDAIVASHVLEHLSAYDVMKLLRRFLLALAPGGRLLIEAPQGGHSYLRLSAPNAPHTLFLTGQGLQRLVLRAGGTIITSYARAKTRAPLRKDAIYVPPSNNGFARTRGGGLTVIAAGPKG